MIKCLDQIMSGRIVMCLHEPLWLKRWSHILWKFAFFFLQKVKFKLRPIGLFLMDHIFFYDCMFYHCVHIFIRLIKGIDTWLCLHASVLGFSRSSVTCKKEYFTFSKQYRGEKLASGVLDNEQHECKCYESMDQWWH